FLFEAQPRATWSRDLIFTIELVNHFDAHLSAIYLKNDTLYSPYTAKAVSVERYKRLQSDQDQHSISLEKEFNALTKAHKLANTKCEWRNVNVPGHDIIPAFIRHARYTDLSVMGHIGDDHSLDQSIIANTVIKSGRPVLLLPDERGHLEVLKGGVAVVGWDGSRGAVRALHDAIPLLKRMDETILVCVDGHKNEDVNQSLPGADIAPLIHRYGLKVSVEQTHSEGRSVEQCLNLKLKECSAKLLIIGAFSNTYSIIDRLFGSTCTNMIEKNHIPIFISH
ncbi:MAG: universal stress protein, partial [Pseudomonadota bacterium]